jgi:aspartate/methionine/tyrosine aminotransferase
MRQAQRMAHIQPFHVMEVLARANAMERAGRPVIHMEVGEPDFPTPPRVVEAGIQALREGRTRYTPALGLPELRERIAGHYPPPARPSPERIAVVPGSSAALQIAFAALLDPGDEVLIADPGYPCNANFIRLYGGEPVAVPCGPERRYQLDAATIRAHWGQRTRAVLVASPANPSGTVIAPAQMQAIAETVRELGGTLIVDEIYHGLVYDKAAVRTALHDGEDILVVNSFSKYYGMTGWRLGWLVMPPALVDGITRLAQNLFISAPTVAQHAALEAFSAETTDELERRRDAFRERRDFLLPALRELGFEIPIDPEGAFYIYAGIGRLGDDAEALAGRLLEEAEVAITPGRDFGSHQASSHVRFSYANRLENLQQAVERLAGVLG